MVGSEWAYGLPADSSLSRSWNERDGNRCEDEPGGRGLSAEGVIEDRQDTGEDDITGDGYDCKVQCTYIESVQKMDGVAI